MQPSKLSLTLEKQPCVCVGEVCVCGGGVEGWGVLGAMLGNSMYFSYLHFVTVIVGTPNILQLIHYML